MLASIGWVVIFSRLAAILSGIFPCMPRPVGHDAQMQAYMQAYMQLTLTHTLGWIAAGTFLILLLIHPFWKGPKRPRSVSFLLFVLLVTLGLLIVSHTYDLYQLGLAAKYRRHEVTFLIAEHPVYGWVSIVIHCLLGLGLVGIGLYLLRRN